MSQRGLWNRTFIVLMLINFCSALSFYLIMVKIVEYAIVTFDVSYSIAATLITAYVIAALLTRMLFGGMIDTWGVKRALAIGSSVNLVAMVLYLVPLPFWMLIVVRIAHGFGFAIMSSSAAAGAALVIPRERYGEGIGYFSMTQALATGIGPFVAIIITNLFGGFIPLFIFASAIAAVALASLVLLDIPLPVSDGSGSQVADPAPSAARSGKGIGSLLQLSVIPLASVLFLVYLGYSGILSFVTVYAAQSGLEEAVSLYFVIYAIVILITRPLVGRRVDRLGENSTIYACFIVLAIGFAILAFAVNGGLLLLSAAFIGFGIGATQSIIQAVIARDTDPSELGKANSTFFMSMDLGSGVGPIIIGALIPVAGYRITYLLLGAVSIVALIVYRVAGDGSLKRVG